MSIEKKEHIDIEIKIKELIKCPKCSQEITLELTKIISERIYPYYDIVKSNDQDS